MEMEYYIFWNIKVVRSILRYFYKVYDWQVIIFGIMFRFVVVFVMVV